MSIKFFYIAVFLGLLPAFLSCSHPSPYNPAAEPPRDTIAAKDIITDSVLARLFHPDELYLKMIFRKIPPNHNDSYDFAVFYKYYKARWKREQEYNRDSELLDSLFGSIRSKALRWQETDRIINKWRTLVPAYYYNQVLMTPLRIRDNDTLFTAADRAGYIHKYFSLISDSIRSVDPLFYKAFIDFGGDEVSYLKTVPALGLAEKRKALLMQWLNLAALYQAAIDTNFDFHQTPWTNVPIPQGFKGSKDYFAGISPNDIKEPELRQAYYEDLVKNAWFNERYSQQTNLRKNYKELTDYLKNDIYLLYKESPYNTAELDVALNSYISDTAFIQSIHALLDENAGKK